MLSVLPDLSRDLSIFPNICFCRSSHILHMWLPIHSTHSLTLSSLRLAFPLASLFILDTKVPWAKYSDPFLLVRGEQRVRNFIIKPFPRWIGMTNWNFRRDSTFNHQPENGCPCPINSLGFWTLNMTFCSLVTMKQSVNYPRVRPKIFAKVWNSYTYPLFLLFSFPKFHPKICYQCWRKPPSTFSNCPYKYWSPFVWNSLNET